MNKYPVRHIINHYEYLIQRQKEITEKIIRCKTETSIKKAVEELKEMEKEIRKFKRVIIETKEEI
jgi:hypothetical protein